MKRRLMNLLSCIVVIALLVWPVKYMGELLKPNFTGDAYNTIDTFHSLPEDTVEVMIYGSSRAWKGFNATDLYHNYGIGAFNYGCNWQHINTTALFFKDSLRTQSPKVAVIEAGHINYVLENTELNGEILYTNHIDWFDGKAEYLKQCFGDDWTQYLSYFMPLIPFHGNWSEIGYLNYVDPTDTYGFRSTMGYLFSSSVQPQGIPDHTTFAQHPLGDNAREILDEIVAICKENNIELIFYTVPSIQEYNYGEAMRQYAEQNGCTYFDFYEKMEEAGLDPATDMQDGGHLNNSGAKKVADYIGRYIAEKFDVTDMRTVPGNIWENTPII